MYKTIIVDDERLAREELKRLLKKYAQINIINDFGNPKEAIEQINIIKPDLLFLDIQMPEFDGFQLLEKLTFVPHTIFVTAYDEFAVKAFEVNALAYVVKPIDEKRLEDVLMHLEKMVPKAIEKESSTKFLSENEQVFLKDGDQCWFVKLSEIGLFESEGNYVRVYFKKEKPMILKSLNLLEKQLNPDVFFRANRGFIVNLNHVVKVENWFGGRMQLELTNGNKIEVSRRQSVKLKELKSL